MVHGRVAAGGSGALAELIDLYGEGLHADFGRVYGVPLADYVMGRRPPGEGLARIKWLPHGSAFYALRVAHVGPPKDGAPDPSLAWFGWDRTTQVLADLWNLQAQKASGKKRAPTYPTPGSKQSAPGRDFTDSDYAAAVAGIRERQQI